MLCCRRGRVSLNYFFSFTLYPAIAGQAEGTWETTVMTFSSAIFSVFVRLCVLNSGAQHHVMARFSLHQSEEVKILKSYFVTPIVGMGIELTTNNSRTLVSVRHDGHYTHLNIQAVTRSTDQQLPMGRGPRYLSISPPCIFQNLLYSRNVCNFLEKNTISNYSLYFVLIVVKVEGTKKNTCIIFFLVCVKVNINHHQRALNNSRPLCHCKAILSFIKFKYLYSMKLQ